MFMAIASSLFFVTWVVGRRKGHIWHRAQYNAHSSVQNLGHVYLRFAVQLYSSPSHPLAALIRSAARSPAQSLASRSVTSPTQPPARPPSIIQFIMFFRDDKTIELKRRSKHFELEKHYLHGSWITQGSDFLLQHFFIIQFNSYIYICFYTILSNIIHDIFNQVLGNLQSNVWQGEY